MRYPGGAVKYRYVPYKKCISWPSVNYNGGVASPEVAIQKALASILYVYP